MNVKSRAAIAIMLPAVALAAGTASAGPQLGRLERQASPVVQVATLDGHGHPTAATLPASFHFSAPHLICNPDATRPVQVTIVLQSDKYGSGFSTFEHKTVTPPSCHSDFHKWPVIAAFHPVDKGRQLLEGHAGVEVNIATAYYM